MLLKKKNEIAWINDSSSKLNHLIQEWRSEKILTLLAPTPQNGQTNSNNLVLPTNCSSVFDHFVRLALKGLNWRNYFNDFHKFFSSLFQLLLFTLTFTYNFHIQSLTHFFVHIQILQNITLNELTSLHFAI